MGFSVSGKTFLHQEPMLGDVGNMLGTSLSQFNSLLPVAKYIGGEMDLGPSHLVNTECHFKLGIARVCGTQMPLALGVRH